MLVIAATGTRAQLVPPTDAVTSRATAIGTAAFAGRPFQITPTLSLTETYTDNVRLTNNDPHSDLITQLVPSLHVSSNGVRLKGFLDYSLTGIYYARDASSHDFRSALNAAGSLVAVENWAFVDATASISQQAVSAFGTRTVDPALANGNRAEVRTYNVSPYLRGRIANFADYEARLSHGASDSSAGSTADNSNTLGSLRLNGDSSLRVLSWSADATHQVYDYSTGRRTLDDRVRGIVRIAATSQLRLSLIEGRESNNFRTFDRQTSSTPGYGVDWTPSERTRLSAQQEKRQFGNSHSLVFEHRMARSVWRYSDIKDVSTGFGQPSAGSLGTAYDLAFAQLASTEPDPVRRAPLVDQYLLARGISPNSAVYTGSLASAITLQRRQELSFSLQGVRDTITVGATQTQARRLDAISVVSDDFANGNVLHQRGVRAQLSHRLTPSTALSLTGSIDRTRDNVSRSTDLRAITLGLSGQAGRLGGYSLGVRHMVYDSPTDPYRESAIYGTLSRSF